MCTLLQWIWDGCLGVWLMFIILGKRWGADLPNSGFEISFSAFASAACQGNRKPRNQASGSCQEGKTVVGWALKTVPEEGKYWFDRIIRDSRVQTDLKNLRRAPFAAWIWAKANINTLFLHIVFVFGPLHGSLATAVAGFVICLHCRDKGFYMK